MVEIREANQSDNDALLELQRKCPMGIDFIVAVDSSPDYFARSKPYKDPHVFVATEKQEIVGSVSCATEKRLVQGKPLKTAFLYGMMVDPTKRRAGVASQLQRHIEAFASKQKVDLCHLLVMEENLPSIKLCKKMGFEWVKDCISFSLMVYKPEKLQNENNMKTMTQADITDIVSMINETYHGYDFYDPYDEESFQDYIKRLPQDNQENIPFLKEGKDIQACLGYWDYNKVIRERVQKLNTRLKAISLPIMFLGLFTKMPKIPKTGETLKQWYLFPIASKDAASLEELIKHVNNTALKNDITMLAAALDYQSPLVSVLSKFRNVQTKLHYFVKPMRKTQAQLSKEGKIYIDIADI